LKQHGNKPVIFLETKNPSISVDFLSWGITGWLVGWLVINGDLMVINGGCNGLIMANNG